MGPKPPGLHILSQGPRPLSIGLVLCLSGPLSKSAGWPGLLCKREKGRSPQSASLGKWYPRAKTKGAASFSRRQPYESPHLSEGAWADVSCDSPLKVAPLWYVQTVQLHVSVLTVGHALPAVMPRPVCRPLLMGLGLFQRLVLCV